VIGFGSPAKDALGKGISGIAKRLTENETRHPRKDEQPGMEIAATGSKRRWRAAESGGQ
jgi:hypothetical protein